MNMAASFMAMQPPSDRVLQALSIAPASSTQAMAAGKSALAMFISSQQTADLQAAAAHFAQALIEDDSNAEACRCLAFIYCAFNQHDTAKAYLKTAAAIETDAPGLNGLKRLVHTAKILENESAPDGAL